MSSQVTAVVLHGKDADLRRWQLEYPRRNPTIVDERSAVMLAAAYSNGADAVASRVAGALFPTMTYSGAYMEFVRQHEPTYYELRNYLANECHVAPLLAARVALRFTRERARVR